MQVFNHCCVGIHTTTVTPSALSKANHYILHHPEIYLSSVQV